MSLLKHGLESVTHFIVGKMNEHHFFLFKMLYEETPLVFHRFSFLSLS
jgi:hypothetical protein